MNNHVGAVKNRGFQRGRTETEMEHQGRKVPGSFNLIFKYIMNSQFFGKEKTQLIL